MAQLIHEQARNLQLSITSPDFARALDDADDLKNFRHLFALPPPPSPQPHDDDDHRQNSKSSSSSSIPDCRNVPPSTSTSSSSRDPPVYLCANSLGLMPLRAKQYLLRELDTWGRIGVEGWFRAEEDEQNHPWATLDEKIVPLLADVVGAKPSEVVSMNALTINLHLMMIAFYKPTTQRFKIVVEDGLFCSDSHAIRSQLALHGLDPDRALIKVAPQPVGAPTATSTATATATQTQTPTLRTEDSVDANQENGSRPGSSTATATLRTEDIVDAIQENGSTVALVLFSGIQYYTGQLFDIPAITRAGHAVGAVVGWDLAHAAGNVVLHLHDWDVDFACWCSYKYMNSGPGAVGGAFVHERHHHADRRKAGLNGLDGWWGQSFDRKFEMGELHDPIVGAQGFQTSTIPVLTSVCLLASLEIFQEATMERITAKQRLLTGYLEALLNEDYLKRHIQILTPSDVRARGSQLSLKFNLNCPVRDVHNRLEALGVICDVREPDVMRIGPSPLYNSFADILRFADYVYQTLKSLEGGISTKEPKAAYETNGKDAEHGQLPKSTVSSTQITNGLEVT